MLLGNTRKLGKICQEFACTVYNIDPTRFYNKKAFVKFAEQNTDQYLMSSTLEVKVWELICSFIKDKLFSTPPVWCFHGNSTGWVG